MVVAVCPDGTERLARRYPDLKVKDTLHAFDGMAVEHLRFVPGTDLAGLPGMEARPPTRLRDAVGLAFTGGAAQVDLIAVHVPGARPWDVWVDDVVALVEPFLADLKCTMVLFPDAVGPPTLGAREVPTDLRLQNLATTVRRYTLPLFEHQLVAVLDLPPCADREAVAAVKAMQRSDVALVSWEGHDAAMARHGWRCGAALVAGQLSTFGKPHTSALGKRIALHGGRETARDRLHRLGVERPYHTVADGVRHAVVRLRMTERADAATIESEPTLRGPVGMWPLPLIRTVKVLHHRVQVAGNLFVFRPATDQSAIGLRTALRMALDDFVKDEVLGGADGAREPTVSAFAAPDPAQPSLVANVTAYLRPWLKELRVNVAVRPGQPPTVEVA